MKGRNEMKKCLLVLFIIFEMSSIQAKADLLLEPYLNILISGKDSETSNTYSGNELGARIGWSNLGLTLGLDVLGLGVIKVKGTTGSVDLKPSGIGVFISYTFPILVRGYLSYFPTYTGKVDSINFESTGSGSKIGLQYTGLPFVYLGLELESISNKSRVLNGSKADYDRSLSFTHFTVSAPFSF